MSDIERWTIRSAHDFTDHETGESYRLSCRVRGPEVRDGIEVVRASDYEGAVEALRHILESAEHPSLTVRSTEYIAKVAGDALTALALPRTEAP